MLCHATYAPLSSFCTLSIYPTPLPSPPPPRPGPSGSSTPRQFAAAARVLAAEGAHLSPLRLLAALGDDMPLHLAAPTCTRVLEGLLHRRRQGQVVR
jgi:hypothetical protein